MGYPSPTSGTSSFESKSYPIRIRTHHEVRTKVEYESIIHISSCGERNLEKMPALIQTVDDAEDRTSQYLFRKFHGEFDSKRTRFTSVLFDKENNVWRVKAELALIRKKSRILTLHVRHSLQVEIDPESQNMKYYEEGPPQKF